MFFQVLVLCTVLYSLEVTCKVLGQSPPNQWHIFQERVNFSTVYILKLTSNGIRAFLVSRWQESLLFAFLTIWSMTYFQPRLFCCHTPSNLTVGTLSRYTSLIYTASGWVDDFKKRNSHILRVCWIQHHVVFYRPALQPVMHFW